MSIIDKFGSMVGNEALQDPKKARNLLLAGYHLQEARLLLAPDKELPPSGRYAARVVMKNIIQALAKPGKCGDGQHFCAGRAFDGCGTHSLLRRSAVLLYGRYKV